MMKNINKIKLKAYIDTVLKDIFSTQGYPPGFNKFLL
jgi:hypothetical protein